MAILTYLVDLFDVYDKVAAGLVDSSHLESRLNTLRLGVMKTANAKVVWSYWKHNRSQEFIDWFEEAIYGEETLQSSGATSLSPKEIAAQGIKLNNAQGGSWTTFTRSFEHRNVSQEFFVQRNYD